MIVIDTNVVSEMMRPDPDDRVSRWIETAGRLHTTAITLAEIDYGIARLPQGVRRERLAATAAVTFADFSDMVLPFDAMAARRYGAIVSGREGLGRPVSTADAQIAAICASRGATLATRNTADFEATGISLYNPWSV